MTRLDGMTGQARDSETGRDDEMNWPGDVYIEARL
jgi:hypothetical protein